MKRLYQKVQSLFPYTRPLLKILTAYIFVGVLPTITIKEAN
jgi:hypothetical protein